MKKELIALKINGRLHELAAEPNALLIDVIRQQVGLTGTKRGCDESSCGACTILLDGTPMLSCTMLAASYQHESEPGGERGSAGAGNEIMTVEGVAEHGALAAIQKAYGEWGGSQCGYCTPGFMMTVKALLERNPEPSDEEIRAGLSGNLCRCTGYNQMYLAIKAAIKAEQQGVPRTR